MNSQRRLCERLCAACIHHHAHDYDGACFGGTPFRETELDICPCPHKHGAEKCDGEHAAPECPDQQCWRRVPEEIHAASDRVSEQARFAAREFLARIEREMGAEDSAVVRDRVLFAYEMGYLRGHGDGMRVATAMWDELRRKGDQ